MSEISWNNSVKLILSDVDEMVADLYVPADPKIITELNQVLESGVAIFFISGHGLQGIKERVTDLLRPDLRKRVLISHCSGVEVWGYKDNGDLRDSPYHSLYDEKLNQAQRNDWRAVMDEVVEEFKLVKYPASSIPQFMKASGNNPLAVMYVDRGPQITFEVINGYDLSPEAAEKLEIKVPLTHGHYDLRIPILERAEKLLAERKLPISPRLGGVFALDFAVEGLSKTTSVKHVVDNEKILRSIGVDKDSLTNPNALEIWGDKFSVIRGGADRHMCEAVDPKVRAIDFRIENPEEFLPGYNIQVWDGDKHLQEGLLEYLQSRKTGLENTS
ncbi:hypothetical protein A2397_05470 [Candidatus Amesbacteria bacterium RIFOXYB1_FULL_44_23]|uniref:Sucrose phosphatase-like domain-containing protein n=1 Tax=Candidatus Amesbacteria bacterium RIFOXYB1_FULL_44_23 TaxID=1797263 RepID=A0A1F4ZQY6_9BACT|nr:MAG: hypothetical protein A2397_05470 [Candidatus Amesbacteria bacterium RIFOXYB1_FULL_44_23]